MWRREADPLDPVDRRDHPEQRAEVRPAGAVSVHGLSEQHDLLHAARGQLANLAHEIRRRNRALAAARKWYHAERAELVASAHRGYVGAHAAAVVGSDIGVSLSAIEPDIYGGVEARAANHLRQSPVTVRPRDHVEERGLVHDRDAIVLRHASEQPELHLRPRILQP